MEHADFSYVMKLQAEQMRKRYPTLVVDFLKDVDPDYIVLPGGFADQYKKLKAKYGDPNKALQELSYFQAKISVMGNDERLEK